MIELSSYNLRFEVDENLREVLENPVEVRLACDRLEEQFSALSTLENRAQSLAMLGSLQRMLGELAEAELSLLESLRVFAQMGAQPERVLSARLRLAHVLQWQARFKEADEIVISSLAATKKLEDKRLSESHVLHQYGQSRFDQRDFDLAARYFYDAMMIRVGLRRDDLADRSRFALDRAIVNLVPPLSPAEAQKVLSDPRLPLFVHNLVNRTHAASELPTERCNCINAALNFFRPPPYNFVPASPSEALSFLREKCVQLTSSDALKFGDILTCWSRSGGAWDERTILVAEMDPADPKFPFGLVFEHMAVVVGSDLIFHKPSPALAVPYKVERVAAASAALKYARGFEMTRHRVRDFGSQI